MRPLIPIILFSLIFAATAQDETGKGVKLPADLKATLFTDTDLTPSPACIGVSAEGVVYIGVDLNGSLGKGAGKGHIIRAVDTDHDGKADRHTVFANIDNPRGLVPMGSSLFVLHTVIPAATGILEAMHLSVLEDKNGDGVADGPAKHLIQNISPPKHNQARGADHTTNGIQMGIDGWIYIAVGDFGIHGAKGTDGKELTMLGGGIVRVRPDGSEMEVYTHGLRNIYDMAIDPRMNLYTRGNTNDGGGWNMRFIHQIQSGEYGYPMLFKHFTDEIIPALEDLGGGSGTGALYFSEPGWPEAYTNVPMMCDWGRSQLIIHRLEKDGASYTQKPEDFIRLSQISDLDVDGSGQLYLSAWDGAGYKGSPKKGYTVRVTPTDWTYKAFPDVRKLKSKKLIRLMLSKSAKARLRAQQELVTRKDQDDYKLLLSIAASSKVPLDARVAAIFTVKQWKGADATKDLVTLCTQPDIREYALRALTDRKSQNDNVPIAPFLEGLKDPNPRVQVAAAIGLGRLGRPEAAGPLLATAAVLPPPAVAASEARSVTSGSKPRSMGPHATPNSSIIVPHVAVQALRQLDATEALVDALKGSQAYAALWALKYRHEVPAAEGVMNAHAASKDPTFRHEAMETIIRLAVREKPYDGSWWWNTRPDTHGPYYKTEAWAGSSGVQKYIHEVWERADAAERNSIAKELIRQRVKVAGVDPTRAGNAAKKETPKVDLTKVDRSEGEIGKMSIENVMLALDKVKGKAARGRQLFTKQGCVACHTLTADETLKGPYMGHVGSILNREQIAESILKPNASISQGFATMAITLKNGEVKAGFISAETADEVDVRDIAGNVSRIKTSDIKKREELEMSMMPPGLANALSMEDFASLVQFLSEQKK